MLYIGVLGAYTRICCISVLYVVHQCVVGLHQCMLYVVHQCVVGLHQSMLYICVLYAVHQCVVGLHQSMLYISVLYVVHLHRNMLYIGMLGAYTKVCCTPVCYGPTTEYVVHQCVVGLYHSVLFTSVL